MSDAPNPPAGWFADPEDESLLRYWDGTQWTDHRAPRYAEPQPLPYGARPTSVLLPERPVAVAPLLAGGGLLILAGVGRAVSYLAPYESHTVALLFSALEVVGWAGAFLAFFVAGYPSRGTAARVLTLVLVGIYAVTGLITVAISTNPFLPSALFALIGLFGLVTLGVGIAFAVLALRSPGIVSRLRVLPLALYLGLIAFGILGAGVNAALASGADIPWQTTLVVGGISGLVPITIGALFLAFGRAPNTSA
jgi:hypothetical protein